MRRAAVALLAGALAGCGADAPTPGPAQRDDPFAEVRQAAERRPAVATAAPRWEAVQVLRGRGTATREVSIAASAIQWRARWSCRRGRLSIRTSQGAPVADGRCPGPGTGTTVGTGRRRLEVRASGSWKVEIEQQVNTGLSEPPLRAMRRPGARVLARGRVYGIERHGRGTASLYRLPSGRLALRFEDLRTSNNTDLFVWASRAGRPRTTRAAFRSPHTTVAPLSSTLGDQNYLLPRRLGAEDVRSIVIWCEPVRIAYAAAALRTP